MSLLRDMAINSKTLKYIEDMIEKAGFEMKGLKMCELGNQKMVSNHPNSVTAKQYFSSLEVKHTSIDINGKDGALKLDLGKPISLSGFDVVTNLGTSEHVKNHKECFNNINNFCRVGGIIINVLPAKGSWLKHKCYRRYTTEWFLKLAEDKNYEILHLSDGAEEPKKTRHVYCTLRRTV